MVRIVIYRRRAQKIIKDFLTGCIFPCVKWLDEHNGFLTAISTVFIAVLTCLVAIDATEQNAIADRQLNEMQVSDRPWISIDVPKWNSVGDTYGDGLSLSIEIKLTNTGHLPAFDVITRPELYIPVSDDDIAPELRELCRSIHDTRTQGIGTDLFPGDFTTVPEHGLSIDQNSIDSTLIKIAKNQGMPPQPDQVEGIPVVIMVCADYVIPGTSAHHQTAIVRSIHLLGQDDLASRSVLPYESPVSPNLVILDNYLQGDYAN
jgi:hypothetical protein